MKKVRPEDGLIFDFNKEHQPILTVESGSTVEIETCDCFENQIESPETVVSEMDWNRVNPATGPIFLKDAEPGDILKVKIEKLEIGEQGVMVVGPGLGVMGHKIKEMEAKIIPIREGMAHFDNLQLPLTPMIGVMGVAPKGEGINCGTPGSHGGNMDTTLIKEGATVYFPVFTEGALFATGDFHAAMGDGEISVSGVEIKGKVTVTLEVIKGESISHPYIENEEVAGAIVSAETLDEAVKLGTEDIVTRISEKTGRSIPNVTMLMSAVGQAQVSQVVDPLVTARFVVPQGLLQQLGVRLIG
ncbi:acetamidase/formamidase family protein [Bacillaceae bacterium S4-13-56]